MNNNKLRLLVISDLHAIVDSSKKTDSHLYFNNGESEYGNAFINYVKKLDHDIDVLICAGDIANQAEQDCFIAGWNFVRRVKDELNIPELLCVPGNHDHQSRTESIYDPKHQLQFIQPSFPFDCSEKNTHFWAWHWCHSEGKILSYNAISLNTSAYHGFNDEGAHGRISSDVADQISKFISSQFFVKKPINILLCHHHPQKMEHVDRSEDNECMQGGQYLLHKLHGANKGPWLVIHGHKHFADVTYAPAPGMNPYVIFSSGSISARLHGGIEDRTSNQFYIIEIDLDKCISEGKAVGTLETHERLRGLKWGESTSSNLPAKSGFGSAITPKAVADKITALISESNPYLNEQDLSQFHDLAANFTPHDFNSLVRELEENGLSVDHKCNVIVEVGKRNV